MGEMTDQESDDIVYLTKKYGGTLRKGAPRQLGVVRPDGRITVRFVVMEDKPAVPTKGEMADLMARYG